MGDSSNTSETAGRAAVEKIVNAARTAFFVTESGQSTFHGRPLANAKVEPNLSALWFATQRQSGKASELEKDQAVLLGYVNGSGSEWASVNGTAELVNDRAKIKELWSPIWKNWFEGPDDPNIELIRVTPHSAEYWDSGNKAVAMIKLAVGAITGKNMEPGKHEKVQL